MPEGSGRGRRSVRERVGGPPIARFIDILPAGDAQAAFLGWRSARRGAAQPQLWDVLPDRLPRKVLPWALLYRTGADGELVSGFAGEELRSLFGSNPKGQPVLAYAPPAERDARRAVIDRSMTSGLPVWFVGSLLFRNKAPVPVGRLCLPVAIGDERAFLLLYFILADVSLSQPLRAGESSLDERHLIWAAPDDLADPPAPGLS